MTDAARTRMSAAEFMELPETNIPTELIDGELIVSPTPIPKHQRASLRLAILIDQLIPDGEVFTALLGVYFDEENIPEPDIIWVAANSRCVIGEKLLEGPPDLLVEIFSPSTSKRDKREKFDLYERYGVYKYWMVDPIGQYIEVYRHLDGKFVRQGVYGEGESFESAALGKTVTLKGIFGG